MTFVPEPSPAVRLRGVGRRFGTHDAVRGVDLTVHPGERVALLGPSGSGKSTLLALVSGALTPSAGSVEVFGQSPTRLVGRARRRLQRRIGTVGQRLDLIEHVRVVHNVNAGRLGRWSSARALASLVWARPDDVVRDSLERVGLGWALWSPTDVLSGGEQQRVAIARMLVQRPELVLADEPTSSLDPVRAEEVLELLSGGAPGQPDPTLLVSLHQPELARRLCTRAIGLRDGALVFDLPTHLLDAEVLDRLYVRAATPAGPAS